MKRAAILLLLAMPASALTPAQLRATAHEYYEWQKREFPVFASDLGAHERDDSLTDYRAAARHAGHDRAGEEEPHPAGASLRAARHRLRALHRSALQREP